MGRASGFIAMQASMASGVVDICLIPEISFSLDKLVAHVDKILERSGHCVICVAEGAGQVRRHSLVLSLTRIVRSVLAHCRFGSLCA